MKNVNENIIEIKNLVVDFPVFGGIMQRKIDSVHAVRKVSFDLIKGETLGIVGESGSGKSTLGNAILNVLKLTAPEVNVEGEVLLNLDKESVDILNLRKNEMKKYRKYIQMIFQDPYSSLNPRMTIGNAIMEPMQVHSILDNDNERKKKVEELLSKVNLDPSHFYRYPHEFSGGQRQRIGIARALATEPKIVIADEPVSALDVSIQAQVINLMMDLQEEFNLTILFIAHDLSVVKHISEEIAVMYLGELVEFNSTNEIFNKPQHPYTKKLLKAIPIPDPKGRDKRKKERIKTLS